MCVRNLKKVMSLQIQFENEDIEFKPLSADCKVGFSIVLKIYIKLGGRPVVVRKGENEETI